MRTSETDESKTEELRLSTTAIQRPEQLGPFSSSPVVDVHCHLLDKSFDDDRDDVISRAKAESVVAAIEGAQNLEESKRMLSERTEFWRASAGIHPSFVRTEDVAPMLEFISAHARDIVAVGEVGLDYYPEKTEQEKRDDARKKFRANHPSAKETQYEITLKLTDLEGLPKPITPGTNDVAAAPDVTLLEAERVLADFVGLESR